MSKERSLLNMSGSFTGLLSNIAAPPFIGYAKPFAGSQNMDDVLANEGTESRVVVAASPLVFNDSHIESRCVI